MPEEAPKTGTCALCGATCAEENFCFGCKRHICDKHPESPWGSHKPEKHDPDPFEEEW